MTEFCNCFPKSSAIVTDSPTSTQPALSTSATASSTADAPFAALIPTVPTCTIHVDRSAGTARARSAHVNGSTAFLKIPMSEIVARRSMASNPRQSNGSKRRKLQARVFREENVCHLCDQWVDTRLTHGLPGSPELDELVPIAFGGDPFDRANIKLAHRRPGYCNRLRWHGPIRIARERLAKDRPVFGADGQRISTPLRSVSSRSWLTSDQEP